VLAQLLAGGVRNASECREEGEALGGVVNSREAGDLPESKLCGLS